MNVLVCALDVADMLMLNIIMSCLMPHVLWFCALHYMPATTLSHQSTPTCIHEIVYISTIVSSQRVSCSNRLIGMLTTAGKSHMHMGDDV
jgi:hypothetical protein